MILNTCELLQSSGGAMSQSHNKFPPPFPAITRNLKRPFVQLIVPENCNFVFPHFLQRMTLQTLDEIILILQKKI